MLEKFPEAFWGSAVEPRYPSVGYGTMDEAARLVRDLISEPSDYEYLFERFSGVLTYRACSDERDFTMESSGSGRFVIY